MINPMPDEVFPLENDYDVYCWLKVHLPKGFYVVAEPSTDYYSEWLFRYLVLRNDVTLVRTFKGDFREIVPGVLVEEAKTFLEELDHD